MTYTASAICSIRTAQEQGRCSSPQKTAPPPGEESTDSTESPHSPNGSLMSTALGAGGGVLFQQAMTRPFENVIAQRRTSPPPIPSTGTLLRNHFQQGGIAGLYSGMVPCVVGQSIRRCFIFGGFDIFNLYLHPGLAGALAGSSATALTSPLQRLALLKATTPWEHQTSFYQTMGRVFQAEGLPAMYKGVTAAMLNNAVFNGAFFALEAPLRQAALAHFDEAPTSLAIFSSSFLAAIAASVVANPFDLAKTRIQNHVGLASTSIPAVMLDAARNEGCASLWRGMPLKWVTLVSLALTRTAIEHLNKSTSSLSSEAS